MKKWIFISQAFIVFIVSLAVADVRLPSIISDNMVIQADTAVPIWGWASPGEKITLTINDQKCSTSSGTDGKWMIKLKPIRSSDKSLEMTIAGKNTITIKNILIGQVWLASGQSNMQFYVKSAKNGDKEIQNAVYPSIRLFTVPPRVAFAPAQDCNGRWFECTPQSVTYFSAVAYFFGREIHKEIKQPVGLINSSWGGTIAETWMSPESLHANPAYKAILQRHEQTVKMYPNGQTDYEKYLKQWQTDANEAAKTGKPAPVKQAPPFGQMNPNGASLLYDGMISPIIPYAIKGAIWYQGESNASRAKQYETLFPALIADWRKQWQQGDFPFFYVQIANFKTPSAWMPDPNAWVELREAQFKTLSVANTGMAVATDLADANVSDIHPKNKQEVGRRLALWALAKTYGKKIEYSGPLYNGMKIEGNKIILSFQHVDGGLVAKGGELKGFTIAGKDQKFVPAKAVIKDKNVIVESSEIKKPLAVRYAWTDVTTQCNFYNAADLPASPFRTDNWREITESAE